MTLTDSQLKTVRQAVAMLPSAARESFVRLVSNRLAGLRRPSEERGPRARSGAALATEGESA
jgi:hypothetical protein